VKPQKSESSILQTGMLDFANRMVQFFMNTSNPIRDRNLLCFGKILLFPCKELRPAAYKYIGHVRLTTTAIELIHFIKPLFSSTFYFSSIRSSRRCRSSMDELWFLFFLRSDATWPEERCPHQCRRCPSLPLDPIKSDPPIFETGASNFCSFEQEPPTPYSMCAITF
jgi:hypothetical protein